MHKKNILDRCKLCFYQALFQSILLVMHTTSCTTPGQTKNNMSLLQGKTAQPEQHAQEAQHCTKSKLFKGNKEIATFVRDIEMNSLEELDLSHNEIGDEEVIALAEVLKNISLRKLNLSYNKISDKGAIVLAEALKTNTSLEELHLSYNHIGAIGAVAFAEVLKHTGLQKFDLSYNKIGVVGESALVGDLQASINSSSLITLRRIKAETGVYGVRTIIATWVNNRGHMRLQQVDLRGNIGDDGIQAFLISSTIDKLWDLSQNQILTKGLLNTMCK